MTLSNGEGGVPSGDEERKEKKREIDEIAAAVTAQKVEKKTEIAKEENEANAAAEEDVDKNEFTKFLAAFSQQLEEGAPEEEDVSNDEAAEFKKDENLTAAIRCLNTEKEEPSCFFLDTFALGTLYESSGSTGLSSHECLCGRCHCAPDAATTTEERAAKETAARLKKNEEGHAAEEIATQPIGKKVAFGGESGKKPSPQNTQKFQKFKTLTWEGGDSRDFLGGTVSATAGGGDALSTKLYRDIDEFTGILDSGCSKHMLNKHIRLLNKRQRNMLMTSANGETTLLDTEGDFELPAVDLDGNGLDPLVLSDCSQLKGSPLNLLSVSVLCQKGTTFHFEKGNSYFIHGGNKFKLQERHGLYLLRLDEILAAEDLQEYIAEHDTSFGHTKHQLGKGEFAGVAATYQIWHERFGHSHPKRLKFLYDHGSVEGMDVHGKFKHDRKCQCEACLMTNNQKLHIGELRKHDDNITRKGQLVYSDICGPYPTSVEGYRYCISFTDCYSRFSAAYMLKKKSDATEALRALIRFYKKNGIIIGKIRTDQGGEFGGGNDRTSSSGEASKLPRRQQRNKDDDEEAFGSEFQRACDENGITHELMPAHRPELHGIAERWNRTVTKMANSMLSVHVFRTFYGRRPWRTQTRFETGSLSEDLEH